MSLKFFADHCVPTSVIQTLRQAGHEVLRLGDYTSIDSPDPLVISKAQELDAILLSLDGDFADIVSYPPAKYRGIVALQVRNHPEIIPQRAQHTIQANVQFFASLGRRFLNSNMSSVQRVYILPEIKK